MKNIALTLLMLATAGTLLAQRQLTSATQVFEALQSGKTVQAVFHYHKCEPFIEGEQEKMPQIVGGMDISTFEFFGEMSIGNPTPFVVASKSKLIKNPIGDGYVYNYAKVKVRGDETVSITAQYLNPETFAVQMNEEFRTTVNDGKNDSGAFFFTSD